MAVFIKKGSVVAEPFFITCQFLLAIAMVPLGRSIKVKTIKTEAIAIKHIVYCKLISQT